MVRLRLTRFVLIMSRLCGRLPLAFFGREREQVAKMKDWHLQKYHSTALSRDKNYRASTPSRPLVFSHSFDVVVHLASPATVGTAVALGEIPGSRASTVLSISCLFASKLTGYYRRVRSHTREKKIAPPPARLYHW